MARFPDQKRSKEDPSVIVHNVPLKFKVQTITSSICVVTEDQLDKYANNGIIINVLLTLFGIAAGTGVTCWAAIVQGNMTPNDNVTFFAVMWGSLTLGIIFLISTIWLYWRQQKQKKRLFTHA